MTLGEKIIRLRKAKKISQKSLAQRLGIFPQNLSRIEKGKVYPRWDTIQKLSQELGVSIPTLFEGVSQEEYSLIVNLSAAEDDDNRRFSKELDCEQRIKYYFPDLGFDPHMLSNLIYHGIYLVLKYVPDMAKEKLKKIGITESDFQTSLNYKAGNVFNLEPHTFSELLLILNEADQSIIDFLNHAVNPIEYHNHEKILKRIKEEIELLLDNLYLDSNINKLSDPFAYITSSLNTPPAIIELITDKKNMTFMKITPAEIIWLSRIPSPRGKQFTKQDYIDMLYFYRKAQEQT